MNKNNVINDWVNIRRDHQTGIESIHAHFCGHAYDAHDHDEVLVGVTQQGLQRFHCHRTLHTSHPGRAILIEPGAVHDGHAIESEGFTYLMLYLPQTWVSGNMQRRGLGDISDLGAAFSHTLTDDQMLITAIRQAFLRFITRKDGSRVTSHSMNLSFCFPAISVRFPLPGMQMIHSEKSTRSEIFARQHGAGY